MSVPVGATVLLATDGLTEARDASGTFFGDEGVARVLAEAPDRRPGRSATCSWPRPSGATAATIADDLAILAMRVLSQEDGTDTVFSTMEAAPRR